MKKLLTILLLTVSVSAMAHGPHYGHYHHYNGGGNWNWVAPMVIGGAIGYAVTRPVQPVVVQQTPPVVYQTQNCGPWTQIQNPDGTVTTTRTCYGVQ